MGSRQRDWAVLPFGAGLALASGCVGDALAHGSVGIPMAGGLAVLVVVASKVVRHWRVRSKRPAVFPIGGGRYEWSRT